MAVIGGKRGSAYHLAGLDWVELHAERALTMDLASVRRMFRFLRHHEMRPEKPRAIVDRDARFDLHGSVIYRPTGELTWRKGAIENLSLSGMLMRGEIPLPVNTPIEMSFQLEDASRNQGGAGTFCWGKVVRTVMPTATDLRPELAVRIVRYQSRAPHVPQIHFKSAA